MSGSSPGQTPRSSTSSPSATSASSSHDLVGKGSTPPAHQTFQQRGSYEPSLSNGSAFQNDESGRSWYGREEGAQDSSRVRRMPRTSGGFLVDTAPIFGNKIRARKNETIDKGKSKDEEASGFLSTRKMNATGHRPKPSIGSSPLALEVTNVSTDRHGDTASLQTDHKSLGSRMTNGDTSIDALHTEEANRSPRDKDSSRLSTLDTDPTHIINLALNLSESRRRQSSFGRVSSGDPIGSRRITSNGSFRYPSSPVIGSGGGNLKQQLQQRRRISRNASPKLDNFPRDGNTSPSERSWHEQDNSRETPTTPTLNFDIVDDLSFNPSDATLLRAERAQQALELFYEYRRVLQYLPKLPNPKSRPNTARGLGKKIFDTPEMLGRSYNPLQYIRNRKVRRNKRQNLHGEACGWKDVVNVRSWVDAVADEREEKISRVDNKYPLPPFGFQGEPVLDGPSLPSSVRNSQGPTPAEPPRPRVDWITTPWDMLADAYWLHQDDHKYLIEDRDGDKIYIPKRSSVDPVSRISQDLTYPSVRRSQSIPRPNDESSKTNASVAEVDDEQSRERGRKRHQFRSSITSLPDHGGSQDRKSRWPRNLIRSRSSSSSEESTQGSLTRQQRYGSTQESRERQESAVLERQVMELLAKEAENLDWQNAEDVKKNSLPGKTTGDVVLDSMNDGTVYPNVTKAEVTNSAAPHHHQSPHSRASLELPKPQGHDRHSAVDDIDSTAPNSPVTNEHVPSIAINLSPPGSRSSSVTRIPSLYNRTKKGIQSEANPTGGIDLGQENVSSADWNHNDTHDVAPQSAEAMTNSSPSDGFLSPKTAEGFGRILRHRHSESKSTRASKDPESRFRGFLKGGRLAELVGTEVSRVGDIFWRKDSTKQSSAVASPASSHTSDVSDTDDDAPASKMMQSSRNRIRRTNADEEDNGRSSQKPVTQDLPKYHLNNLPSFRSPFRRDDDPTASSKGEDHILRQQIALRGRGRPSRLNDLAPPNLDMRGLSSSRSPPISRVQTHETDTSAYNSRRNSANPSESGPDEQDIQRSRVKGLPARLGAGGPTSIPMTGLASLDVRRSPSKHRLSIGNKSQWSISDRAVSPAKGVVTRRDIIRTRALLLSSGIKAQEIARRAHETPDYQPPMIQDLERCMKTTLPYVPRSQRHVLAARCFVKNISETNVQIRSAMDSFSNETAPALHDRIKALDQFISADLTPMVRAAADDADALSMELASSYRLSVKRLNDSIDFIVRRKRRRFRWVRRSGWTMLEWLLLGVMWCVWLVVVVVRLVRAVMRGVYKGLRWVLWLE